MRRGAIGIAIGIAVLASVVGTGSRADAVGGKQASLDPATADAFVALARSEGLDGFCKTPLKPLSLRTRELCPLAKETKGCEGLVAACAEIQTTEKEEGPNWSFGSLGPVLSSIANLLMWTLIAAVVGVILWLVVTAIMRAQRDKQAAEKPAEGRARVAPGPAIEALEIASDAEVLLRQAHDHARRGDLDRAAGLYLAASLRALDQRGAIRIARHRTNGEYVRSCREVDAKPDLRAIVREVDRVQFGRERATAERVADIASRAIALVTRAAPAALLAIAVVLFASGCSQHGPSLRALDPAGDDLFVALLEKEGASVSRLRASLATMPMPAPKEIAPLVVIDAARVPLEDETRAHLERWVEAGGRLLLAGDVRSWPESFKAKAQSTSSTGVNVLLAPDEDEDDVEEVETYKAYPAKVGTAQAIAWPGSYTLASTDTHELYAAARSFKKGVVIGLAGDDLLTNAGIARPPNAAALIAIVQLYAAGRKIHVARPEDGISPPSNPLSSLTHAGLGLGLAHAAAATLILILAFGMRQARAKVSPPPARRAWTEHIEATGGLYARAKLSPHALAAYARFVDGRLRERMLRGMTDPAAFLALRANADPAWVADVWRRAMAARPADMPVGDELLTLRHLSALYAAALKNE
jgi:uncharacterized protein DUF4350